MAKKPKKWSWTLAGRAMCSNCMARFADGKRDCENTTCPLYSRMPFRQLQPNLGWMEFNPKRNGYVDWEGKEYSSIDAEAVINGERIGVAPQTTTALSDWNADVSDDLSDW